MLFAVDCGVFNLLVLLIPALSVASVHQSGMRSFGLLVALTAITGSTSARSGRWRLNEVTAPAVDADGTAYGIVIDAGSTGSRLHVFSWNASSASARLPVNLSIPIQIAADEYDVEPGISDPQGLALLDDIIEHGKNELAGKDLSKIPIFLKATAGMRILPSAERESIMTTVRSKLANSGFQWICDSQARVISGEEEGVFGWISVNFRLGHLKQGQIHNLDGTLGALDLGGASTQITFKPADPDILSNLFPLALGQQVAEDLYTHSFLHFGQNEALRRATQTLVENAPAGAATVPSPCYLSGYSFQFFDVATGKTTTITGSSNFSACQILMTSLLDKDATCLTDPTPVAPTAHSAQAAAAGAVPPLNPNGPLTCSIAGVYQPQLTGASFIAFSGYSFIYEFLGLNLNSTTPDQLRTAASAFCSLDWAQAQKQYPSEPPKYLNAYCASSTLAHTLIAIGYGVPHDSDAVTVAPSSAGYDWALGSMLWDANQAWRIV